MSTADGMHIVYYAESARTLPLAPLLEQAGGVVRVCNEDLEALALVLRGEADVVCVDVLGRVPERFLRILRRRAEQQALSILAVQREPEAATLAAALRAGADGALCDHDSLEQVEAVLQAHARLRSTIEGGMRRASVLERALDLMDEAALIMNREGRVLHANRSCLRMLDLDPDVLRERSVPQLLNVLGVARETIDRVMHSEEALLENIEIHTTEGARQVVVDCRRLDDVPADPQRQWLVQLRDSSLLHTLDRMEADFRSWADHELRSHLAVLTAEVEAFEDLDRPLHSAQISGSMRREVENLAASIEARLREVDRPDLSDEGDLEELQLVSWLENSLAEVEALAMARHQSLRLAVDPDSVGQCFRARSEPLQQILRYALVDAVRSCPDGAELRVEVELVDQDLHVALRAPASGRHLAGETLSDELSSARAILQQEGGELRLGVGDALETRLRIPVFVPRRLTSTH